MAVRSVAARPRLEALDIRPSACRHPMHGPDGASPRAGPVRSPRRSRTGSAPPTPPKRRAVAEVRALAASQRTHDGQPFRAPPASAHRAPGATWSTRCRTAWKTGSLRVTRRVDDRQVGTVPQPGKSLLEQLGREVDRRPGRQSKDRVRLFPATLAAVILRRATDSPSGTASSAGSRPLPVPPSSSRHPAVRNPQPVRHSDRGRYPDRTCWSRPPPPDSSSRRPRSTPGPPTTVLVAGAGLPADQLRRSGRLAMVGTRADARRNVPIPIGSARVRRGEQLPHRCDHSPPPRPVPRSAVSSIRLPDRITASPDRSDGPCRER